MRNTTKAIASSVTGGGEFFFILGTGYIINLFLILMQEKTL